LSEVVHVHLDLLTASVYVERFEVVRRCVVAEAGLFIGWGAVISGREKEALEGFGEVQGFWARMQQEGRIESFETVLLEPHGGDLAGFILVRGTREQVDAARIDEDFRRRVVRGGMVLHGLGVVSATLGEGLEQAASLYQEVLDETT
jgi:hypothetical protein